MVFISLTSAYIVRQGLPTFDGASNSYVRDWGRVDLPWLLLAINTAVLLISSVTMEFARRKAALQAALAPVKSIPGISLGNEKSFPWLGITVLLGVCVSCGAVAGLGRVARSRILCRHQSQQFVCVSADDCPRDPPGRGNDCVDLGGERFPAAQAGGVAADRGGHHRVVLAFHGGVVDLRVCLVGICAIRALTTKDAKVHEGCIQRN